MRSIAVLVGGTTTAHLITALAMPISTRLFTPTDFTAAAAFSSLVGIISVAACLRFDIAIALPEDDREAVDLLALSLLAATTAACLTSVMLLFLPESAFASLNQPRLRPWLWLLPVGVLVGGAYLALQMWFVRRRDFPNIAKSRIAQSASAASGQLALGFAGYAPLGLIVGQLLNYGAGSIWLICVSAFRDRHLLRRISIRGMARAFLEYRRFPIYSTSEALANAASIQAPMLLIAAFALGPEAGYLTLAFFLLQMPMALIGNAIGQVYISRAPIEYRGGNLDRYTETTVTNIGRAVVIPIVFIGMISPHVFAFLFGSGWERAGLLVAWMTPWFFMQLLVVPVSTALHVVGRQRTAMSFQIGGLLFRLGAVIMALAFARHMVSEIYAVSGFGLYAAYLWVVLRSTGMQSKQIANCLLPSFSLALVGTVLSILLIILAKIMINR